MRAPMQATLNLERIERRIALDIMSDAEWLLSTVDESDGQLRILASRRYTDDDVRKHGAAQVLAWIAKDRQRHRQFQQGEWWWVTICAVAVVGVHLGDERIGQVGYQSMVVSVESDVARAFLDRATDVLVTEVRDALAELGFTDVDSVPTPYAPTEPWVADGI